MLIPIPKLAFDVPTLNGLLGKFGPKSSKLSFLPENWHAWYLKGADSEFGLTFLKLWDQKWFLVKFRLKKSTLPVFPDNFHKWYLGRADLKSRDRFSQFQPQNPFFGKFGPKKYSLFVLIWDLAAALNIQLVLDLYLKIAWHSSLRY